MNKDVLYVGSGNSALLYTKYDLSKLTVCAVNNAHRLFDKFDYWIIPSDFPKENHPEAKNYRKKVTYTDYKKQIEKIAKTMEWEEENVQIKVGYTMFFNGLYWIMGQLKPKNIYTLGFDHDYNAGKLEVWNEKGQPSPINKYNGLDIEKEFGQFENDSFYGVSTPDPMRFGEDYIKERFQTAKQSADKLGIKLWNLSSKKSINTLNKISKPI